jgi:hypothetical protein
MGCIEGSCTDSERLNSFGMTPEEVQREEDRKRVLRIHAARRKADKKKAEAKKKSQAQDQPLSPPPSWIRYF